MRDADVRSALRATVLARHVNDPGTLVVEELGLERGAFRVDVAVVNGRIHGYEIKSDADTLERLPAQVEGYGRVLDRVTLVVGSRHAEAAQRLVPEWWGIYVAEGEAGQVRLRTARRDRANPGLDLEAVAALLWRDEAVALLTARGRARGLMSKPRRDLCRALVEALSPTELRRCVREALKSRTAWRAA